MVKLTSRNNVDDVIRRMRMAIMFFWAIDESSADIAFLVRWGKKNSSASLNEITSLIE